MKINLLLNLANQSWIIQKIADRLAEELIKKGVLVSITEQPDDTADLVHHMSWAFANIKTVQPSTMFITHLDDYFKLQQVKSILSNEVRVGICMSSDTMQQLLSSGCQDNSVCYISPAHDSLVVPRRKVIGITTRLYSDGRKREDLLVKLAKNMDLSQFEFQIFGDGWGYVIGLLEKSGAKIQHFPETCDFRKDYENLLNHIPYFDYYLYLGMDEGSLGTLDALAAGIPTIITPQGFHLDISFGITYPIVTYEDLQNIFNEISMPIKNRVASVAGLTWENYAARHLAWWESLLNGTNFPSVIGTSNELYAKANNYRESNLFENSLSPRRILSFLSHVSVLRDLRKLIDKIRFNR